jgi:hypothetical protein
MAINRIFMCIINSQLNYITRPQGNNILHSRRGNLVSYIMKCVLTNLFSSLLGYVLTVLVSTFIIRC